MVTLCIKILLDQNLSYKLTTPFSNLFAECIHINSIGMEKASDRNIWKYAAENNFVILTKDYDFNHLSILFNCPPKVIRLVCGNMSTSFILNLITNSINVIDIFTNDEVDCIMELT